jgi:DNA processing protein
MNENHYLVLVSSFTFFGSARCALLLSYFGSARKIWTAKRSELLKVGLSEEKVGRFDDYRRGFGEEGYFKRLKKLGISFLTIADSDYPVNLRGLPGTPTVLYVKGAFAKTDINALAIVGSRKMTAYGQEVTEKFARELAGLGVTIVSGLARGVDTAAHRAVLEAHGRTIAVMGCGLNIIYPPENMGLAKEITAGHGVVISEYPLDYPPLPQNFAARNRIISGLAKGVIVVEGTEHSGTLLTASHAAEQGKAMFAVPGQITSPLSFAPLFLIKNGAKMVTNIEDVLEECPPPPVVKKKR